MTHEKRHNFTVFLATVLQKKDACLADTTAVGCISACKSLLPSSRTVYVGKNVQKRAGWTHITVITTKRAATKIISFLRSLKT